MNCAMHEADLQASQARVKELEECRASCGKCNACLTTVNAALLGDNTRLSLALDLLWLLDHDCHCTPDAEPARSMVCDRCLAKQIRAGNPVAVERARERIEEESEEGNPHVPASDEPGQKVADLMGRRYFPSAREGEPGDAETYEAPPDVGGKS